MLSLNLLTLELLEGRNGILFLSSQGRRALSSLDLSAFS